MKETHTNFEGLEPNQSNKSQGDDVHDLKHPTQHIHSSEEAQTGAQRLEQSLHNPEDDIRPSTNWNPSCGSTSDTMRHLHCPFHRDLMFLTEAAKEIHMRSKHFYCRPCTRWFNDEGARRHHWSDSPRHGRDYCKLHDMIFEGEGKSVERLLHMRTKHFFCGWPCDEYLDTKLDLAKHRIEKHWGYLCPFGCAKFAVFSDWEWHMDYYHYWSTRADLLKFSSPEFRAENLAVFDRALTYCRFCRTCLKDCRSLVEHQACIHVYLSDPWMCKKTHDAQQEWLKWHYHLNPPEERGQPKADGEQKAKPNDHENWVPPEPRSQQGPQGRQDAKPQGQDSFWKDFRNKDQQDYWKSFAERRRKGEPDKSEQELKEAQEQEQKGAKEAQEREQREKANKAYWDKLHRGNARTAFDEHAARQEQRQQHEEQPSQDQQRKAWEREKNRNDSNRGDNSRRNQSSPKQPFPDHYAKLGLGRNLLQGDIEKIAKKRRIEAHPDKLARLTGLTPEERSCREAEAREVGQAADILSDAGLRSKYDRKLREHERG